MHGIAYAPGHGDAGVTFCRRWVVRGVLALAGVATLAAGIALTYGLYLSASLALPAGDEHPPRLIYGAPFLLKPDLDIASSHLLERLNQLVIASSIWQCRVPGDFASRLPQSIFDLHEFADLHLRPFRHGCS